jgi:hypothetical protein
MAKTYIPINTLLVCPRKLHRIGVTNDAVQTNIPLSLRQLDFEAGQERVQGEPFKCRICGSPYYHGGKVHTENGWSPDDPQIQPVKEKDREMKAKKFDHAKGRPEDKDAARLKKARKDKPEKKPDNPNKPPDTGNPNA